MIWCIAQLRGSLFSLIILRMYSASSRGMVVLILVVLLMLYAPFGSDVALTINISWYYVE